MILLVDASATATVVATSTVYDVIVSTYVPTTVTTSTTSTAQAIATGYAACAFTNILAEVNGYEWTYVSAGFNGQQITIGSAVSDTDCCTQCQALGSGCAGFIYAAVDGTYEFVAQLDGTCSPGETVAEFQTSDSSPLPAIPDVLGNSGCGQWAYGGYN